MKELFVKIKNVSIISIIASALIGIFAIARPSDVVHYVSMFVGIVIILMGVYSLILYFATERSSGVTAVLGIMAIVAGLVVCFRYKSIIAIVIFIFGLFLTTSGIVDFFTAFSVKLFIWPVSLMLSIATVTIGVIVMINPFDSMDFLVRLLGVGLLIYAVMDLLAFLQVRSIARSIKKNLDETIQTVDPTPSDTVEVDAEDVKEL